MTLPPEPFFHVGVGESVTSTRVSGNTLVGDPVLNLGNPPGITSEMQHSGLKAINELNRLHHESVRDPECALETREPERRGQAHDGEIRLRDVEGAVWIALHGRRALGSR
jgi:hypothetical protein